MIRPDKIYDEVVKAKIGESGDLIAGRGKLDKDDGRRAYVTRKGIPVASFWHESEAIRYMQT